MHCLQYQYIQTTITNTFDCTQTIFANGRTMEEYAAYCKKKFLPLSNLSNCMTWKTNAFDDHGDLYTLNNSMDIIRSRYHCLKGETLISISAVEICSKVIIFIIIYDLFIWTFCHILSIDLSVFN
uniref:Uncharacterized protein n=1 Tax=Glossina palpalis gambiensis TaxID=67801 RepID=A0A1B0B742_9MUSC